MQASKSAGKRTALALKPMGRVTQSPHEGKSVAPKKRRHNRAFFEIIIFVEIHLRARATGHQTPLARYHSS